MRPRDRPLDFVAALGLVAVIGATVTSTGILSFGYSKSGGALLFHAGLYYLLLAGLARLPPDDWTADRHALVVAGGALVLLLPLAVAGLWYDLALTPPASYGASPTLRGFAIDRFQFVGLLAPMGAMYVAGAFSAADGEQRSILFPIGALLGAAALVVLSYAVAVSQGSHPGFTGLFYGLVSIGSLLGGIPLFVAARWKRTEKQSIE